MWSSHVQNERTALRQEDGRYLARSHYSPASGLNANGRITLLIRDPDDKAIARFAVDLPTISDQVGANNERFMRFLREITIRPEDSRRSGSSGKRAPHPGYQGGLVRRRAL